MQSLTSNLDAATGTRITGRSLEENLDIFERATAQIQVQAARRLPGPTGDLINSSLLEAILTDDLAGARRFADASAKLIEPDKGFARINFGVYSYNRGLIESQLWALHRSKEAELLGRCLPSPEEQRPDRHMEGQSELIDKNIASLKNRSELTESCYASIDSGDRQKSTELAEKILAIYKEEDAAVIKKDYQRCPVRPQNLFTTVINIARDFLDRGWLEESTKLLKNLRVASNSPKDWPLADTFIETELVLNKVRSGNSDDNSWNDLATKLRFFNPPGEGRRVMDFNPSEKLRRLALSYYFAGERDRARIIIERALAVVDKENSEVTDVYIVHTREGIGGDRVMLFLVAAGIYAENGDFERASHCVEEALKGPVVNSPAYGVWLAEITSKYMSGKRPLEAESFLKRARAKDMPIDDRHPRTSNSPPYQIDYWLALVLSEEGKKKEAFDIIEQSIKTTLAKVPRNFFLPAHALAGDLALEQNELSLAAIRYEQAGASEYLGPVGSLGDNTLSIHFFKKALDCALKSPSQDKAMIIRLHRALAEKLAHAAPQESLNELGRALSLMSDEDADKASLIVNLLDKQTSLRVQAAIAGKTISDKDLAIPPAKQLELLEKAAGLAESFNQQLASSYWLRLASQEAAAGQYDRAVRHAIHSIDLYREDDRQSFDRFQSLLPYGYGGPLGLSKAGREKDAEDLLRRAAGRVKAVKGPRSYEAMIQLGALFRYYVQAEQFDKAGSTLDEILSCDLTIVTNPYNNSRHIYATHQRQYNGLEPVFAVIRDIVTRKKFGQARTYADKILSAQLGTYSPNDGRLVATWRLKGQIDENEGDCKSAAISYKKVFEILRSHYDESGAIARFQEYIAFLRRLPDRDEADRLEKLLSAYSQANRYKPAIANSRAKTTAAGPEHPDPSSLTKNKGESDSSFLSRLAGAYERVGKVKKAAEILEKRARDIELSPMEKAFHQTDLAQFYIRNNAIPKAQLAWQEAGKTLSWNLPNNMARSIEYLIQSFSSRGLSGQADQLVDQLLDHPNKEILEVIDPIVRMRVAANIQAGKRRDAETLVRRRVEAVNLVPASDTDCYWRILLSELCLANGKQEESQKIFDQVIGGYQFSGRETGALLKRRNEVLDLAKAGRLDLTRRPK